MEYLVLWEISKKQNYIFKSNKLSENVGASLIIKDLTEDKPHDFLTKLSGEVVFEGGGKSLYKFKERNDAENFIKEFSTMVIEKYPGVELFCVIQTVDINKDSIIDKIDEAYIKLGKKKNQRRNYVRQVSFGLERKCFSTSLPAHCLDDRENNPISRESSIKQKEALKDKNTFEYLIPDGYKFSKEFNDLVNKDKGKNYLAIVHIDGNKMGSMFEKFKEDHKLKLNGNLLKDNSNYLKEIKRFSESIKECYETTFREMCEVVAKNEEKLKDETNIKNYFPVRPLILAGDDISFITNAKIGIECARIFLKKLTEKTIKISEDKEAKLNACAGVAIVKTHYPFSKAYALAEGLCKNAKELILREGEGRDYSVIDWHIEQGEISGSINQIRSNFYKIDGYNLTMKPIYINNNEKWYNYENFMKSLTNISGDSSGRNKIKKLREVFRKGPEHSEIFIKANGLNKSSKSNSNIILPLQGTSGDFGFNINDKKCMYFDAIETMDLFIELEE